MNKNMDIDTNDYINSMPVDLNKIVKKSRYKLITLIISITIAVMVIIVGVIPSISMGLRQLKFDDYTRMLSNLTQFDRPVYNNGFTSNGSLYQFKLGAINSTYQDQIINTQSVDWASVDFLNRLKINDYYVSSFDVDPIDNNINYVKTMLEHNPNNTAIINFSLNDSYSLEELKEFFELNGIVITWLAVETGYENSHNDTINMENGQYNQFGFPTFTSINSTFETKQLDINNPDEYMDFIRGEWKWSLDNKKLVSKYKDLYVFKEIESVLNSSEKIYGFTAVGTTKDLLELCDNEKLVYGNIGGIYPWTIINK